MSETANPLALPDSEDRALKRVWRELNDLGNAQRLYDHSQGLLLWVDELETWAAFDGQRWSILDGVARAEALAHKVSRGLRAEVAALRSLTDEQLSTEFGDWCTPDIRTERVLSLHQWATKSGDSGRTQAMLKQARALTVDGKMVMRAALKDFDTDPLVYNLQNGTLHFVKTNAGKEGVDAGWRCDFEEGHRPTDMLMQIAAVTFDPEAKCPAWRKRLTVLQPNDEQRTVIARLYGYTMLGLISDQAFYVFQGKGGDGKSMTNWVISQIHNDYFRGASPKTFLEGATKSGSDHQSDIVRLRGDIRFVVCDEPKDKQVWDGERIKQVTGSSITARGAHATTEISFVPRWKLFIECNPLPRAPSDDDGFRRRFKLYLWPVQLHKTPGLSADSPHIVQPRLLAEKSGILNWMIAGAIEWLTTMKIPETAVMTEALANYWAETSPLGDWFDQYCDLSDNKALTAATPLYKHFTDWSEAQGRAKDKVMSQTTFGRLLTNKQIMAVKGDRGIKFRRGVRLRAESEVSGEAEATVHGSASDGGGIDAVWDEMP